MNTNEKCQCCGAPATRSCQDDSRQFMCGFPLCDDCEHVSGGQLRHERVRNLLSTTPPPSAPQAEPEPATLLPTPMTDEIVALCVKLYELKDETHLPMQAMIAQSRSLERHAATLKAERDEAQGKAFMFEAEHAATLSDKQDLEAALVTLKARVEKAEVAGERLNREAGEAAIEIHTLKARCEELEADKERLDWLEKWIAQGRFVAEPRHAGDCWELGYNGGPAYIIEGQGETLRAAIDQAHALRELDTPVNTPYAPR